MSNARPPFGRVDRILARLDFGWSVTGNHLAYIEDHGLWGERFRPGGPHGLWIAGHLAFYEGGSLRLYRRLAKNRLDGWKDHFSNGSPCLDELARYPSPETVLRELKDGRKAIRETIAGFTDADLDTPVSNERLAIRDWQSQIEFMVWHESHHAAQLGAIANNHRDSVAS